MRLRLLQGWFSAQWSLLETLYCFLRFIGSRSSRSRRRFPPNAKPRTPNAKRRTDRVSGYLQQLLVGTVVTIEVATISLLIAFVLGLLGAAAKLSSNRWLAMAGSAYTTLIRAVPDLVLMLLL